MDKLELIDIPPDIRTRDAVVRHLLGRHAAGAADRLESAYTECMFRESLGSTGIGNSVAVSEVIATWVPCPTVVAGRLPEPVAWTDGEPVRLVFLIVAPDHSATLPCLTAIRRYLR